MMIKLNEISDMNHMTEINHMTDMTLIYGLSALHAMESAKEENKVGFTEATEKIINQIKTACKQHPYTLQLSNYEANANILKMYFTFKRVGFVPIPTLEVLTNFRIYSISTAKPFAEPTQIIVQLMYVGEK